ncbi:MAG: FeoB-associated Cys-rich membrane protein [Planctomycetes bacterium]|nr:FeoB-associated Cys-rich membrane protein [Planctomycetota bacterium]MBI3834678.1 FeoB-associated Cys-rich membrane protein [Planctomycetota bacterium]
MNAQDIIAIAVAAIALAFAFRSIYRQMTTGGCGSSCHCSHAGAPDASGNTSTDSRSLKRTPLVTLGQSHNSHEGP